PRSSSHQPGRQRLGNSVCRTRRERPRGHAAEQCDERAASYHSITSVAETSIVGGIAMPSAFAVLRLIANSNLVDCITGKSAGLSPENPPDIDAGLAVGVELVGPVAHQAARGHEIAA